MNGVHQSCTQSVYARYRCISTWQLHCVRVRQSIRLITMEVFALCWCSEASSDSKTTTLHFSSARGMASAILQASCDVPLSQSITHTAGCDIPTVTSHKYVASVSCGFTARFLYPTHRTSRTATKAAYSWDSGASASCAMWIGPDCGVAFLCMRNAQSRTVCPDKPSLYTNHCISS